MKLSQLAVAILIAGAHLLAAGPARALFSTPSSDRAIVLQPLFFDGGNANALNEAVSALQAQSYTVFDYRQYFHPSDGFLSLDTIGTLRPPGTNSTPTPYGALALFTHADGNGEPVIEYFDSVQDVNDQISYLVQNQYLASSSEAEVTIVYNYYSNVYLYGLRLKSACLQRISKPSNAMLHVAACYGGFAYSKWTTLGFASMASYADVCAADNGKNDAIQLWQALRGFSGASQRNLSNAKFGTGLTLNATANQGLVLAPWITYVFPPSGATVSAGTPGYVTFDTAMNEFQGLLNGVTATPPLGFGSSPDWTTNRRVDYWFAPINFGNGQLTVVGSNLKSAGGIEASTLSGTGGGNVIHIYNCIPAGNAVAVSGASAIAEGTGVRVRFNTGWESETESFQLERMDDPANPSWVGLETPATGSGGPGVYEIVDPDGHLGSRYRIVEHQLSGLPDLRYGTVEAGPAPQTVPSEPNSYDGDSLSQVLGALGGVGALSPNGPNPALYVLVTPDSLADSLASYAAVWQAFGRDVDVVTLTDTQSQGGVKGYLAWAYAQGTRYALLVGDGNDAEWWDDPSKWVNGWVWPRVVPGGPHIPSQPERNLIPTTYTADTNPPGLAMSFYTPYYASDLPYADVDNDGLPDLRLGRIPIASTGELRAYTAKLWTYLTTPHPMSSAGLMAYAQDNGYVTGAQVEADADDVAASFLGGVDLTRYTDTESTLWTYATRESLANYVANQYPGHIYWLASGAQRDIYANFWRLDQGWNMAKLAPVASPNRFFVSLGFSCGMGNFDQTENYGACDSIGSGTASCTGPITPISERLLLDAGKGAIAVVGPTRGTIEEGNRFFALAMQESIPFFVEM